MSKARIDDIEQAIIDAINGDTNLAYVSKGQVQTLDQRGIDFSSGQIVVLPPAVLVLYLGGTYSSRNINNSHYTALEPFLLLAVTANLRGAAEAKRGGIDSEKGAYDLVEDLKTLFGGKKLTVATGVDVYCSLSNVSFEGINPTRHFVYGLEITVKGEWNNNG